MAPSARINAKMIMNNKTIVSLILFTSILLILSFIFSDFLHRVDSDLLSNKFRLRGESSPDSSVIILYLDNDDIQALGGWPIKRNYYALVINILNQLGAKTIGLDIAFTESNIEYSDYEELFVKIVKNSNNVVLVSYFESLIKEEPDFKSRLPEKAGYKINKNIEFYSGEKLRLPFPNLLDAAVSVGHENFTKDYRVPIFIRSANEVLPIFSFEILRTFLKAEKNSISIQKYRTEIITNSKSISIPYEKDGTVNLNFLGGINSLLIYPLVEFLQAYNLYQKKDISDIDINIVKDKIVIVGVIAEGRTEFVTTPYSNQFPSIGIHATFILNALNNNFLKVIPKWLEYFITFCIGLLSIYFIYKYETLKGLSILLFVLMLYILVSFSLFSTLDLEIPVARVSFVQIFLTIGLLIYKNQIIKEKISKLEMEQSKIFKKLRSREERLIKLEIELEKAEQQNAYQQAVRLKKEIMKQKDELKQLSSEASHVDIFNISNKIKSKVRNFEGIIYLQDGPMNSVVEFVKKIANSDSPVLILGESGTGKELLARAIHNLSNRKNNPFIAVNCGALSETLLESELFGHEKGSFTGAIKEKRGRFELANNGTIFLDEIAETSEAFQVKLLRVLQEGEFERVGGTETLHINIRVVAATNQNISLDSSTNKIRPDLYYRLSVFVVNLPPLRERITDIPILVENFLKIEHLEMQITSDVMNLFSKYSWPGNVRELHSIIKRAAILAKSENRNIICYKDLPDSLRLLLKNTGNLTDNIIELLRDKKFSKNAISETAKELGDFNRGTVAEHFRGYCLKTFIEQNLNINETVKLISNNADAETQLRVRKKLLEYMRNAVELIEKSKTIEHNILISKPKFKNLPQKYHYYLEKFLEEYYYNHFEIPDK